ncbi:hypothetical protein NPIL_468511, partial [Nephila pilipes]
LAQTPFPTLSKIASTDRNFIKIYKSLTEGITQKLDTYKNLRLTKVAQASSVDTNRKFDSKERIQQRPSHQGISYSPNGSKTQFELKYDWHLLSAILNLRRRNLEVLSQSRWYSRYNDRAQKSTDGLEEDKPSLTCYDCRTLGAIKSKCPTCIPAEQRDDVLPSMNFYGFSMEGNLSSITVI